MRCLMVIDYQKGFAKRADPQIKSRIEKLVDEFSNKDCCVFTKFANHRNSVFERRLGWSAMSTESEQELVVEPRENDVVIEKETYSAYGAALREHMDANGVSSVYLCGMDTEACVLATAYDLFDAGLEVHIIEDACASSGGEPIHEAALAVMRRSFGAQSVILVSDVVGKDGDQ